jgi:hypothetical protein
MENLPDGCFVRLNASIMREGSFGDCLASFVGKFENRTTFVCSDGGRITLSDEQCEMDSLAQDMVVELVGQCLGPDSVAVRSCGVGSPCIPSTGGVGARKSTWKVCPD